MSRSSNLFVSLSGCLLVASCGSTPREAEPEPGRETSGDAPALDAPADGTRAADAAVRVSERAEHQYAEAVNHMKSGRTAEAELEFQQLSAAYPQLSGPEVNLGLIYLQASRLSDAEAAFEAALVRNPGNIAAGNELGIVERKLGKFSKAEAAYQRTIAADPNYAPAYLNLGVLYDLYLAEPRKALEQFEHYLQLVGDNKQVAGWLVELRKRVGAPAPAKKEPA